MRSRKPAGPPPESLTLEIRADSPLAARLTSMLMDNSVERGEIMSQPWPVRVVSSEIAWPPPRYANGGAVVETEDGEGCLLRFRLERVTDEPGVKAPAGRLKTFCVQCGPNVLIDEDGCCTTCGGDAAGPWVERVRLATGVEP